MESLGTTSFFCFLKEWKISWMHLFDPRPLFYPHLTCSSVTGLQVQEIVLPQRVALPVPNKTQKCAWKPRSKAVQSLCFVVGAEIRHSLAGLVQVTYFLWAAISSSVNWAQSQDLIIRLCCETKTGKASKAWGTAFGTKVAIVSFSKWSNSLPCGAFRRVK